MDRPQDSSTGPRHVISKLEQELWEQGHGLLAGVDEVGRGPLAGPVVAAAVVLSSDWQNPGVADSKALSPAKRLKLDAVIRDTVQAFALGICEPEEIDRINIHQASLLAMRRAVEGLEIKPHYLLVDGRFTLDLDMPQQAVVGGDASLCSVSAASILAKVWRDQAMERWHQEYPAYNFASNKGYATLEHREALAKFGPCPIHRRSYRPVAQRSLDFGSE
jgi:ribonuclease HII